MMWPRIPECENKKIMKIKQSIHDLLSVPIQPHTMRRLGPIIVLSCLLPVLNHHMRGSSGARFNFSTTMHDRQSYGRYLESVY